jgi:hypothetical protein
MSSAALSKWGFVLAAALVLDGEAASTSKTPKMYNGAIAYHRESHSWGYAVNKSTAREAQVEALKQCANERCEVVMHLRNNCGAVADGPRRFFVGTGANRQESETKALRACGTGCQIAAWACTR